MKNFLVAAFATASMLLASPGTLAARGACDSNGTCSSGGARHFGHARQYGHGCARSHGGGYRGGFGGGGGVAGLAAGAIIGGDLATQYQRGYGGPQSYCARTYRSYHASGGPYLGYDGLRHRCG